MLSSLFFFYLTLNTRSIYANKVPLLVFQRLNEQLYFKDDKNPCIVAFGADFLSINVHFWSWVCLIFFTVTLQERRVTTQLSWNDLIDEASGTRKTGGMPGMIWLARSFCFNPVTRYPWRNLAMLVHPSTSTAQFRIPAKWLFSMKRTWLVKGLGVSAASTG